MPIPWEAFDFVMEHPELGWLVVLALLIFELRSKRGRIYQLDKKITGSIIVIRALARAENAIDEEEVDDYLVENGMEPEDFFVEDSPPAASESLLGENDNTPNRDERSAE